MVSAKLVQRIEEHWDNIARRAVRRIRSCADLPHLQQMPESEVHQICERTLRNLSHWLTDIPDKEIAARYRDIGRQRCHDGMPLHEAVRGLQLMKSSVLDYVRDQGFTGTSVDILAEEELEHHLGEFYDLLVFHLVRGYEETLRRDHAAAAVAGRR